MKIEKISDRQIRCTITNDDLQERKIKAGDLAYGSEKLKALFEEMMNQASFEFGFERDSLALMIEAVPIFPDSLVVLISKIQDPEELDSRFSTFTDSEEMYDDYDEDEDDESDDELFEINDSLISNFDDYGDKEDLSLNDDPVSNTGDDDSFIELSRLIGTEKEASVNNSRQDVIKIFEFRELEDLIALSRSLLYVYSGENSVFKDPSKKKYYLVVHKSDHTVREFSKICSIISEYGVLTNSMYATPSYYEEHLTAFVASNAIQVLASL